MSLRVVLIILIASFHGLAHATTETNCPSGSVAQELKSSLQTLESLEARETGMTVLQRAQGHPESLLKQPGYRELAKLIRKHRKHPEFMNSVRQDSDTWKWIQSTFPTPASKAASQLLAWIRESKYTSIPTPTSDMVLYKYIYRVRNELEFIETMKEDKLAWELYQSQTRIYLAEIPDEYRDLSPPRRAARHAIDFIKKCDYKKRPTHKSARSLYESILRYVNHPEFIEEMQTDPEAWKVLNKKLRKPQVHPQVQRPIWLQDALLETIELIKRLKYARFPTPEDDWSLYKRNLRYSTVPEYEEGMKKLDYEAWKLLKQRKLPAERKLERIEAKREAARSYVIFIEESGLNSCPPSSSKLHQKFSALRNDPVFIAEMEKHPQAWALAQEWPNLPQGIRAAKALKGALKSADYSPSIDKKIYQFALRFKDSENFRNELKTDPLAWKLFYDEKSEAFLTASSSNPAKLVSNPSRSQNRASSESGQASRKDKVSSRGTDIHECDQAADDTIDFIIRSGFKSVPTEKDPRLFSRFEEFRTVPRFMKRLRLKNPQAYAVFVQWNRQRMLSDPSVP